VHIVQFRSCSFKVKRPKVGESGREFQGQSMEKYGVTDSSEELGAFSDLKVSCVQFRLLNGGN
jgi:hypothetical protein